MSFSPSSFANFAPQSKLDGILGRVGPPIMHTMDDQSAEDFNDYYYTPYHDLGLQEYTPYGVNPLWRGPDSSQLQLSGEHIPEVKPMSPLSPPFTPTFMSSSSVPDTPSSTPSIHTYANSPGSGVASPPTATSSTAIHSSFSRLDRDASTFVPRKKITIKTTSGEEVKFQQAPRNPILTMQAPVNIRIESETEKFRRLVKEQEQQTGNLTPKVLLNGTEDKSQQKRLEKREKKMQRKAERRAVQDLVKSLIPDM
ncbi:hypothetical protein C8Q75DRAFT_525290 [Abortiporus biennis]|nr:hypothetical protein C8Q75DRAFT_525290 [Abortiporus biennis]